MCVLWEETILAPRSHKIILFEAFLDAGLGFLVTPVLEGVLRHYFMELPKLSVCTNARLAIFEWAMQAEGCEGHAEFFAALHEANYQPKLQM